MQVRLIVHPRVKSFLLGEFVGALICLGSSVMVVAAMWLVGGYVAHHHLLGK